MTELKPVDDANHSGDSLHSNAFASKVTYSARQNRTPLNEPADNSRRAGRRHLSQVFKEPNSRLSDQSMVGSRFLTNSSVSNKVPFNINQNSLRKQILDELELNLNIVFLTGQIVSSIESDAQINFDLKKEAYLLGSCAMTFNLKDNTGCENLFLDFCGNQIFELSINGISIPVDNVTWLNNQIALTGMRGGRPFLARS